MNSLKAYRKDNNLRQSDLAKALSVEQAHVSRLESGEAKPGLDLAILIEEVTDGVVPVLFWKKETEATQ